MTKYIVTQITPTSEDPVEFCAYQWGVQRLYTVPPLDDTCCGTNWGTVYSYGTTGGGFAAVNLNSSVSPDNENPCIDGYYENGNGGCGAPAWCESPPVGYNAAVGIGNDPLVECSPESPFLITHAVMYCPFPAGACPGDPSTAIKCFRITIADNCDPP